MKPHLPLKLRAALLAAIFAVSFTAYAPAWAEETGDTLTETKVYEHNETWKTRITGSRTLDSYAEVNISNWRSSDTSGCAINIGNRGVVSIMNSGNILFKNNSSTSYCYSGGAIYNEGTLTFSGNGNITFSGNSSDGCIPGSGGGAIYNISTLTFSGNENITFSGNSSASYGGAICNSGTLTFYGNGNITFSGNSASSSGGAISNSGTLTFSGNGDITFSGNSSASFFASWEIYNNDSGELTFSGNGDILFENNNSSNSSSGSGAISNSGTLTFSDNGDITFSGNSASAISNGGTLTFCDNGDITFSGNSSASFLAGGAIFNNDSGELTFSGNGDILFENNNSSNSSSGSGAIYNEGTLTFSGNGDIIFSGNSSTSYGGAIYSYSGGLTFSGNGDITFSGNSASAISNGGTLTFSGNGDIIFSGNSSTSYGGAIYSYRGGLTFSGNGDVTFSGNSATSSGGAIYSYGGLSFSDHKNITFTDNSASRGGAISGSVDLRNNKEVIFSKNMAQSAGGAISRYSSPMVCNVNIVGNGRVVFDSNGISASSTPHGGAIWASSLVIENNGDVIFRGNHGWLAENYRLNGIYLDEGAEKLVLSAPEGKKITIYDGIYTEAISSVLINDDYTDAEGNTKVSSGTVILTGETVTADLSKIKGSSPTAFEIDKSSTSEVYTNIYLKGGTFSIRNGATLITRGLETRRSSGATLELSDGSYRSSDHDICFNTGTGLSLKGTNKMVVKSLLFEDGATLSFQVAKSAVTSPVLNLMGELRLYGNLEVTIAFTQSLANGTYQLMSVSDFDASIWTSDCIDVTGASFSELEWQGNTLYLNYHAPVDPDPVTDVLLSGNQNVTNNTVISGTAKVEVNGKGTLTLSKTNSYTGGTTIKSGTLVAGADGALGRGDVRLHAGKLDLGGHKHPDNKTWVKDTSYVAAGNGGSLASLDLSTPGIPDGDGTQLFGGVLTLTGTLELDSLKVGAGAISGGSLNVGKTIMAEGGTIAANLSGTATFIKVGHGTLTLKGRNNWTGRTTINEGRLVIAGQSTVTSLDFNGGSLAIARSGSLTVTDVFSVYGNDVELSGPLTLNTSLGGDVLGLLQAYGCEVQNENGTIVLSPAPQAPLASVAMLLADEPEEGVCVAEADAVEVEDGAVGAGEDDEAVEVAESTPAVILADAQPVPSVGVEALAQGTWGVAKASRLFADTVRDHAGMGSTAALDDAGTRSAWFSAMSGFSRTDGKGGASGADTDIYGGALGMQFNDIQGGNAGIAVGQTWGRVSPMDGSSRVTQKTQHAALYADKVLVNGVRDFASVSATAAYATTDSDTRRDGHRFDWAQQSAVLGLRGTWMHSIGNATAVYAYTGAEYLATDSAATENGASGSVQSLKWELGAGVRHTAGKLTVYADAAFRPDLVRHNPVAESDGLRGGTSNPGRLELRTTIGADYRVNGHWSINAGYSYEGAARENNHNLRAGASYTF